MADPRTRTSPQIVTSGYAVREDLYLPDPPPWKPVTVVTTWNDSITDQVSPGYFKAIKTGKTLPVNPLSQDKRTLDLMGNCDVRWKRPDLPYDTSQLRGNAAAAIIRLEPRLAWSDLAPPDLPPVNAALQKALAQARNDGWDVLTFAAEFGKTATMIRRAGKTFDKRARTIYDRVVRYKGSSRKDLMEVFSEMWLEYRYGWRTLMYDLQDADQAIQRLGSVTSDLTRSTVTERAVSTRNQTVSTDSIFTGTGVTSGGWRLQSLIQDSSSAVVRCGVGLEGMLEQGPMQGNVLVTGYELIPYSFVVDWFFNLGEAVAAWAPFNRGRIAYGFTSVELVRERVMSVTPVKTDWEQLLGSPGNSVLVSRTVQKTRVAASPSLDLRFRVNLDGAKVTDIVAMVLLGNLRRLKGLAQRR